MSEPQYIGALIGLFLLSIGFRALMAAQGYLEAYLHLHYYPRPIPPPGSSRSRQRQDQQQEPVPPMVQNGSVVMSEDSTPELDEKNEEIEISRAVLTTAVVGIGYMLMLVVMTYNSAYFGAILAGIFVGEVYFGRWGRVRPIFPTAAHHNNSSSSSSARPSPSTVMHPANNNNNNNTARIPNHYNNHTSSRLAHYAQHPASSSITSVASRASSHGYSAMVHHGAAADGAC
ncbi:hypothetical protein BGX34_010446 [Mortierella sp. NVP85]|nr:hypothetical protein BGX34_010446 [Mortierella sp. NVP85]